MLFNVETEFTIVCKGIENLFYIRHGSTGNIIIESGFRNDVGDLLNNGTLASCYVSTNRDEIVRYAEKLALYRGLKLYSNNNVHRFMLD
jgi:hypothetical protein